MPVEKVVYAGMGFYVVQIKWCREQLFKYKQTFLSDTHFFQDALKGYIIKGMFHDHLFLFYIKPN